MIAGLFASIALSVIGKTLGHAFTLKERQRLSEETVQSKTETQKLAKLLSASAQQTASITNDLKSIMSNQTSDMQRQIRSLKYHFSQ